MTAFADLARENRLLRAQLKKATSAHYSAQLAESKKHAQCNAVQFSDQMSCDCGNVWDMNDPCPPPCRKGGL